MAFLEKKFFPNFRVYKLNGANAMVIVSRLRNKELTNGNITTALITLFNSSL